MSHNTQLLPIDAEGIPQWCNFFTMINTLHSNPTQTIEEIAAQMFYDDSTDNTDIKAVTNTDFATFCDNLYHHLCDIDELPLRSDVVMTAIASVTELGVYSANKQIRQNSGENEPTRDIINGAFNGVAWVNPLLALINMYNIVQNRYDEEYLEIKYDDALEFDEAVRGMPKSIYKTLTMTLHKFTKRLNAYYQESW